MVAEKRWMRWRKRAFQPEALPCVDLVGPLLAVGPRAADVLCDALPLRAGIYGLALELLDRGLQTLALPHVLALTPQARMPTDDAPARAAVERLAARRGRPVTIGDGPVAGLREVRWPVPAAPGVVAVIPSCTPALAARCLAGVAERTSYAGLRAVVVDSSADEDEMRRVVEAAPIPATRVRYPSGEPFNYQVAVNLGARQAADAEEVLFLNDDVLPLTSDWLTRMVELLTLPGVGIVGALLRYPDGRIQHAGVQIGEGSGHRYHDAPGDARGHRFELLVPGNPEAVTGACMLVRAELLEQLGGHDERYVHVYGDVDLCYRASQRGWRVAWCPGAALEHLESASYGSAVDEGDIGRFLELWRHDRAPTTSNRVRA
jgi:GT2 family glycosyltransferase